jgi:hypothetical protein
MKNKTFDQSKVIKNPIGVNRKRLYFAFTDLSTLSQYLNNEYIGKIQSYSLNKQTYKRS